jgi:hypothetical protein
MNTYLKINHFKMKRISLMVFCLMLLVSIKAEFNQIFFSYSKSDNKVVVDNESSRIIIEAWRNDMLKVSLHPDKSTCKTGRKS